MQNIYQQEIYQEAQMRFNRLTGKTFYMIIAAVMILSALVIPRAALAQFSGGDGTEPTAAMTNRQIYDLVRGETIFTDGHGYQLDFYGVGVMESGAYGGFVNVHTYGDIPTVSELRWEVIDGDIHVVGEMRTLNYYDDGITVMVHWQKIDYLFIIDHLGRFRAAPRDAVTEFGFGL
jgi:hypothetical protein